MFGSDKAQLSAKYGDKHVHGVYMSCGNISKGVRSKLSSKVWMMVAQIPVVKFAEKRHQGLLAQRLLHACMDYVAAKLKECSKDPIYMADATGILRLVRTILLSHIADFPEQQAIACVAGDASPISLARHAELGLPACQALRTADYTLLRIDELVEKVDASMLASYKTQARLVGLNGVHQPYWRDWEYAEPSIFLTPDALHQWHIFFAKHTMMWARELIGDAEIDRRYATLQKHIGHRHFPIGFTTFSQHTGREHRDLESSFIAVISGHPAITPGVMKAFSATLEFIYLSQYETVTTVTLRRIEDALRRFHENRHHLVAAGVRNTPTLSLFNIKKLELMQHVSRFITEVGSLLQFTADQTERLHIIMAKIPYQSTNKKEFREQMCRFLDRREKIDLFRLYLDWKRSTMSKKPRPQKRKPSSVPAGDSSASADANAPAGADIAVDEEDDDDDENEEDEEEEEGEDAEANAEENVDASTGTTASAELDADADSKALQLRLRDFAPFAKRFLPKPLHDAFQDDSNYTPRNGTTAFTLTSRIPFGNAKILYISQLYSIPNLDSDLIAFFNAGDEESGRAHLPFSLLDCWDRVRLQLRCEYDDNIMMPMQTVMASPPSSTLPSGLCNFVLVNMDGYSNAIAPSISGMCCSFSLKNLKSNSGIIGHIVAQLRLVFQPVIPRCKHPEILAYVEPLVPTSQVRREDGSAQAVPDENSGLVEVKRLYRSDRSRFGMVIRLTDIWRSVDIVPVYGIECDDDWTSDSAVNEARSFLINVFYTKDMFQSLSC